MKGPVKATAIAAAMVAATSLSMPALAQTEPTLAHWSAQDRSRIETVIANAPEGAYAVFDADNTIWRHDLEESLLPFMEERGELSPNTIDASLKPIPFRKGESLYGYYLRLCAIDDNLCYPWIAQVFSGHTLGELKRDVDALMARDEPIPVRYEKNGEVVSGVVERPQVFAAQRELIAALRAHGIHIYVVTAASEELARMILSDPQYGIDIAPQDVIGVTMVLRDPASGALTTARSQIAKGHFLDATYPREKHMAMVMTPTLWAPNTWYEGKVAGIRKYIDAVRKPLIAAGDSPSDWPMLFQASALRIWVERSAARTAALEQAKAQHAAQEEQLGQEPEAAQGWLIVPQKELVPTP